MEQLVSPIFETVSPFGFDGAIQAMEAGHKVAREGWSGEGWDMWICKGDGHPALPAYKFWNRHTLAFAEENGGTAEVLPYLILKTGDGKIQMGWSPSQRDALAKDWRVVP